MDWLHNLVWDALCRMDDLKDGKLVGEDKYGNKYFENPFYFYGRNRWVEYAPHFNLEYDGSQIPAEWFGWMHYKVSGGVVGGTEGQFINQCVLADGPATAHGRIPTDVQVDGGPQREHVRNPCFVHALHHDQAQD